MRNIKRIALSQKHDAKWRWLDSNQRTQTRAVLQTAVIATRLHRQKL